MGHLPYVKGNTTALFLNHLQMLEEQTLPFGYPTVGPPIVYKPYPILLKYQRFVNGENDC